MYDANHDNVVSLLIKNQRTLVA
uniref:Uncharacterized protein n=1 Tax=Arundo donax TaxID=35708 RepID=A0A0A8YBQ7_ARUDO